MATTAGSPLAELSPQSSGPFASVCVYTWQQLGYHKKPVGVLNVGGYFDPLLEFFDRSVECGFIRKEARAIVVVGATPDELLEKLEKYVAPTSLIESLAKEKKERGSENVLEHDDGGLGGEKRSEEES